MMGTAFLGYRHSPKWFNISNKRNISNKVNITNYKVNKRLFTNIVRRGYCTSSSSSSPKISEILQTIINELGINPIYIYEDINLEDTKKQILNNTINERCLYGC